MSPFRLPVCGNSSRRGVLVLLCLVVGLCLTVGATLGPARAHRAHAPTWSGIAQDLAGQGSGPGQPILPGEPIEGVLLSEEARAFHLSLSSGEFARLLLEAQGCELALTVYEPDRTRIAEVPSRSEGPTTVSLLRQQAGAYVLILRAFGLNLRTCRYRLTVAELRSASRSDRDRIAAERAYAAAESLVRDWKADAFIEAVHKYRAAARFWQLCGEIGERARALRSAGTVYSFLGQSQNALESYGEALEASREAGDHSEEAEALNGLASVQILLGDHQRARESCSRALELSRSTGYRAGEGRALNNLGEYYYHTGEPEKALELYRQALALWRDLGDRVVAAQTLLYLGYTFSDLGDTIRALDAYEQALELWTAASHRRGQALTWAALGQLHSRVGENQEALNAYSLARPLIEQMGDKVWEAGILAGMGYVYKKLGDAQESLNYFNQALSRFRDAGLRKAEAELLLRVGESHFALGESEKALGHYREALSALRALGDHWVESYALRNLGVVFESWGKTNEALDYYQEALELKRTLRDPRGEAETLNSIGHVYESLGQAERAIEHYNRALPLQRATGDRFGESVTLFNLARAEKRRGSWASSRSLIEAALAVVESLRSDVSSRELRTSFFASVRDYHELHVDVLMALHRERPSEDLDALALQASERYRSRSLLEILGERRADIRQGVEPALLEREGSLRRQLEAVTERHVRLLGNGKHEEAAVVAEEIRALTVEWDRLLAEIRSKSPRYAALMQPQPLSYEEIQRRVVDEDTMLLEYALGDERSYLWALTPGSAMSYELPARSVLEAAVRQFRQTLTARQPVPGETPSDWQARVSEAELRYAEQSRALGSLLLGPVARQLGNKRLLIVADGALQYIPFGALAAPAAGNVLNPLVVAHEIVSVPSASSLAVLRSQAASREPPEKAVVVLADPVFEADDPRVQRGRVRQPHALPAHDQTLGRAVRAAYGGLAVPRLLASRHEASAILSVSPPGTARLATGFEASRALATSPELGRYRIVHFATHGLLNSQHPELSGILLTLVDKRGEPQNGLLRLHDIYNLELPVELVVLSACDTALGREVRGEGLVGMVRGFMYAGAARVVASLWKVDDEATGELMKRFYQGMLKDNLSPAAALRAAQVAMWKQKQWSSPFYWAAFVLQGEYH